MQVEEVFGRDVRAEELPSIVDGLSQWCGLPLRLSCLSQERRHLCIVQECLQGS